MNKKIVILFVTAMAIMVSAFANTQNANAASCTDGNGHFYIWSAGYPYYSFSEIGGDNEWSIATACSGENNSRGIMFITGSNGVWQSGSDYYFHSNAWVDKYTTTLYMMGMIHGGTGAKNAYSVGICDSANKNTCLYSYSHSAKGIHVNNNAITSVCDSFQRSWESSWSSLGSWTQPTQSSMCAITFNIDGLRASLADGSIEKTVLGTYTWEGETIEIGRGTIYNTRCQTSADASCGGSGMYFLYDTSIVIKKETTFTGDIDTYVNGTKYDNGDTISVTSSRVSVRFRDKVNRRGGENYTQRACYSGWGTPNSNYSNHCHNFPAGYTSDYVDKTVYVSLAKGSSTTVCHTLSYPTKGREDNTGSDYATTQECVTITRDAGDNDDCVSEMDNTFYKTDYVGKTDAWLIFKKNNDSVTLKDNSTSHTYWAKPGDNIQYEYKLCGGSEYSRTADNEESAKNFGAADRQPVFNVTGKKDGGNNTSYLFGANKSSFTSGSADLKYYAGFTSPSNANYSCHYAGGANTQTNYYQIPAESSASTSCKSSNPTGPSDVGHSFSQEITYRRVTTQRYEVYHPCRDEDGNDCSWYTYGTELASSSNKTLTGTVRVPYNYSLIGMATHSLNKGIIYAGTNFVSSGQVKVLGRSNSVVNGNTAYATRTKNTTIKMVSFTLDAGVNPKNSGDVYTGNSPSIATICNKATGSNNYKNCTDTKTATGVLNDGNNQLTGGTTKNMDSSFAVPTNVTPGMRVCTVIAYWPVDSHDTGNNSGITGENQDAAFTATGNRYAVSAPACVTVAKKPTFSVESSQVVTSGSVTTSLTTVSGRNYGSWSEYGIIAGGAVKNMASGAALGYRAHTFSTDLRNNINAGATLANSGAPEAKTGCYLAPQTMLNNNCSNLGGATRIISNYKGNEVAKKLADMYLMSDAKMATYGNESGMKGINSSTTSINGKSPTITIGGKTYYNYYDRGDGACSYDAATGKYYAPAYSSGKPYVRDGSGYHSPVLCTENGVKYYKVSGDVWMHGEGVSANMLVGGAGTSDLGSGGSSTSYRNVTYVFDFRGTAIIDENMIIDNAGNGDSFSSLDQLPTILIFADDVIITDNVTRLDAWIILGAQQGMTELSHDAHANNGYDGSGELNTCGATSNANSFSLITNYSSTVCAQQLVINSPVYAKKLTLRRNYGAQYSNSIGENGYVQRGEIFNMRPDIYYWTYYQAQRNSILTTVFSRELPVRY